MKKFDNLEDECFLYLFYMQQGHKVPLYNSDS